MPRLAPLLALPLLALALAGCGSSSSSASGGASAGAACRQPCVVMKDISFQPADLKVRVGQTVTWVNGDSVVHDVVNQAEGQGPRSQLLGGGKSFSYTVTRPGTIKYVCTVHPGMTGTLTVTR